MQNERENTRHNRNNSKCVTKLTVIILVDAMLLVCIGLPHNHCQKRYISHSETFKITRDDEDKFEKFLKELLG